jgi:hypothetical protein
LRFGKPKTPGFGISQGFYLCVMASKAQLPTPSQIVNPQGDAGAVAGYIAPLGSTPPDNALQRPLESGSYAVSDLDKKTVLLLGVRPREEYAFDPRQVAENANALGMTEELRLRLAATWWILQLNFESHDPMVYPALRFLQRVAARLGELTDGAIADPCSGVYRLPSEFEQVDDDLPVHAHQFVSVQTAQEPGGARVFTLGMTKFALPEFAIADVPESFVASAKQFLLALCQTVLLHGPVQVGQSVGSQKLPFLIAEGGVHRKATEGVPAYELIPPRNHTVAECIVAAITGK